MKSGKRAQADVISDKIGRVHTGFRDKLKADTAQLHEREELTREVVFARGVRPGA
jgi:hypothetical protein